MPKPLTLSVLLLSFLLACAPSAPTPSQCEKLIAATLAGHNITGLTVTSIKTWPAGKLAYLVTASFTLTPPKGRKKIFNNAQTIISWDYATHAYTDTPPATNAILSMAKEYEYMEGLAANAKNEKDPWYQMKALQTK
jgi:hypothetical protein